MKYIKSFDEFILESAADSALELNDNDIVHPEKEKVILDFKIFKEDQLKKASKNKVNQPVGTAEISKPVKTKKRKNI